jgi:hypothetical protein
MTGGLLRTSWAVAWRAVLVLCGSLLLLPGVIRAEPVIFHLRNGDRITGSITAENDQEVTISSPLLGQVVVPVGQIERREKPAVTASPETRPAQPSPPLAPTPQATPKPTPAATTPPPAKSKLKEFLGDWQGDAQVGVNLGFSTKTHQTYTARLKAVYTPTKTMRNNFDYLASYGTTDGVLSEDQMDGSWKIEYDIGKQKRFLLYNVIGAGYNDIQKVDFRYDVGPGMGYKVIVWTNYVLKAELGGNFQQQHFATGEDKSRYSLRLAEDMTWQITSRLKLDNKVEFFPEVEHFSDYRVRAEANLSYLLRNNLTLSLSVIDSYDTDPADGVSNNDLQIRSLIGVKF